MNARLRQRRLDDLERRFRAVCNWWISRTDRHSLARAASYHLFTQLRSRLSWFDIQEAEQLIRQMEDTTK